MSPHSACGGAAAAVGGVAAVVEDEHADHSTTNPSNARFMHSYYRDYRGSRSPTPGSPPLVRTPVTSEVELRRNLNKPGRRRGLDFSERRAHDVAVDGARAVELRMVEDVERLEAQLEVPLLIEGHAFDEREIEVLDAGTVEKAPWRVAELAERRQAEAVGVERRPLRRIVIDLQVATGSVIRRVDEVVVDA